MIDVLPNGQTLCYGIFGYPIKHSLSPVFQSYTFRKKGINALYLPFEVKPQELGIAIKGARALNIQGLNITIPHKEDILKYVNHFSEDVNKIGSCNTLTLTSDGIFAYNTDWIGFKRALEQKLTNAHKTALVLGAGGTTKAILYALEHIGINAYVYNRTIEKAIALKNLFNIEVVKSPEDIVKKVDIIINATSVGLKDDDKQLFDYNLIEQRHIVFDVIYRQTNLIKASKQKHATVISGLPMLIYQGLESFKIWTGIDANDIIEDIFDLLKQYQKA